MPLFENFFCMTFRTRPPSICSCDADIRPIPEVPGGACAKSTNQQHIKDKAERPPVRSETAPAAVVLIS